MEIIKAPHAGMCYLCGNVFYVGDNIALFVHPSDKDLIIAAHEKCAKEDQDGNNIETN